MAVDLLPLAQQERQPALKNSFFQRFRQVCGRRCAAAILQRHASHMRQATKPPGALQRVDFQPPDCRLHGIAAAAATMADRPLSRH